MAPIVKKTNLIGKGQAGPGRPAGLPNKTTALLKDAVLQAAAEAGGSNDTEGLVSYLKARAIDTPGPFLGLLGKVLPLTVAGQDGKPIEFVTTIRLVGPDG